MIHPQECFFIGCQAPAHATPELLRLRAEIIEDFQESLQRDIEVAKRVMPDTKDSKDPAEPGGGLWRAACYRASWQAINGYPRYYDHLMEHAAGEEHRAVMNVMLEYNRESKRNFLGADFDHTHGTKA